MRKVVSRDFITASKSRNGGSFKHLTKVIAKIMKNFQDSETN